MANSGGNSGIWTYQEDEVENTANQGQIVSSRILSIDALRGFDMFWIIGGDALLHAIGKLTRWPILVKQTEHASWEGFRFYDLIFPLFLFIVGVVIPYSLAQYRGKPGGRKAAYKRIFRRSALLIILGIIYWGNLQHGIHEFRWFGVLQRIGICYFFAALAVLLLDIKSLAFLWIGLLLGYWALLAWIPAPGFAAGDFTMEGNLVGYVDRLVVPGKFCCYPFGDNEGLLSTIPAIGTTLLGALTGCWLRAKRSSQAKFKGLLAGAAFCLAVGWVWGHFFPIIKNLWTSSYVFIAGGYSLLFFAFFYYFIDILCWKRWAFFFVVIGMNPLTIYFLQQFVDFDRISRFFLSGFSQSFPTIELVVLLLGALAAKWLLLLFLYNKGTFLRV
jgi:predicted acyltransferase